MNGLVRYDPMKKTLKIDFRLKKKYFETNRNSTDGILYDADYEFGPYYINMIESLDFPVTLTFSIRKLNPNLQRKMIKKIIAERKTEFHTSINQKNGEKSTLMKQVEDAERILQELDAENSKLFNASMHIKITSDHPVELKDRFDRLSETLGYLGMEIKNDTGRLVSNRHYPLPIPKGGKYLLNSKSLSSIIPIYFTPKTLPKGILVGIDDINEKPVYIDPFIENSHNMLIIGETGSGKSFLVKLLIHRLMTKHVCEKFFIFDPLNEYPSKIFGGKAIFLYIDTEGKILPSIDHNGFWNDESKGNLSGDQGVVIVRPSDGVDFSERAITSMLELANQFMAAGNEKKMLVFDECHIITSMPAGFNALNSMVRHSRHYNASIVNISQNVDDFLRLELASIAYNSNRIFVFRTRSMRTEHNTVLKLEDFDFAPVHSLLGGKTDSFSECVLSSGKDVKKIRVLSTSEERRILSA